MKKETLSDKRKELFDIMIKKMPTAGRVYRIIKQQDREFIKNVLDELQLNEPYGQSTIWIDDIVKKLAGEELIK